MQAIGFTGMLVPDAVARNGRWIRRRRYEARRNVGRFSPANFKRKFDVPSVLGIVSAVSLLGLVVTLSLRREERIVSIKKDTEGKIVLAE